MPSQLVKMYRTAEDYHRYTWENAKRRRSLQALVRKYRRYIGRRVLDLGCGGGVLGRVLESTGRTYLGVDANPDMIREARRGAAARGSKERFLLGDITRLRLPGRFDTVTVLGNSLAHLSVAQMERLLRRLDANVHPGSTFIVDYRDLVAMFWQGTWTRVVVQTHVVGKVVHRARVLDTGEGRLRMRARPAQGRWVLDWTHAIWSPFILEGLMRAHGWRLADRSPVRAKGGAAKVPEHVFEVYRFRGRAG